MRRTIALGPVCQYIQYDGFYRIKGNSQLVADSDEGQSEEGDHSTEVADPEETLVVVVERRILIICKSK